MNGNSNLIKWADQQELFNEISQTDAKVKELDAQINTASTGLAAQVTALDNQINTEETGLADRLEEVEEKTTALSYDEVNGTEISGALSVSGTIEGGEILETMSGYSMSVYDVNPSKGTFTPIYSSIVKTGNKLTIVACGTFNRADENTGSSYIFNITIPQEIGAKLYPFEDTTLYAEITTAFNGLYGQKSALIYIIKNSNTSLNIALNYGQLTASTDYYVRAEATFLLSENMTPPPANE